MVPMTNAPTGADWIAVGDGPLRVAEVLAWAVQPGCGALVSFRGTVRDHSEDRAGVVSLEYEAYLEQVGPRLAAVASVTRARWSAVDRLAPLHRVGRLQVGEVSVVVTISTPHRSEAFEAARFCIDTIKTSVPIWKRETWADGSGWALGPHGVLDVDPVSDRPGDVFRAGDAGGVSARQRAEDS
jgi:molybdopterin synthase catalytic subunit